MTDLDVAVGLHDPAGKLLVDRIGEWWPWQRTFSRDPAADLSIEPMAGGACTEQTPGGPRRVWGTVLSIEPPLYLRLAWQISPDGEPVDRMSPGFRVMTWLR